MIKKIGMEIGGKMSCMQPPLKEQRKTNEKIINDSICS